jgi:hypothetical protein
MRFDGSGRAADAIARSFDQRSSAVRLIYQPDSLAFESAECPKGGRMVIGAALAKQFPVLEDPLCAWSHEFAVSRGSHFTTHVHYEREPGALGRFTRMLETRGIGVESVWPLSAFLLALPRTLSGSKYSTIVALHKKRAFGCRYLSGGGPEIRMWNASDTIIKVAGWLRAIVAENPSESIALLFEDDDGMKLNHRFRFLERRNLNCHLPAIYEALTEDLDLPRHHPAQLIPPPPPMP